MIGVKHKHQATPPFERMSLKKQRVGDVRTGAFVGVSEEGSPFFTLF